MRVLKFGGTSVADAHCLVRVARLVAAARREDEIVVVVSAQAGVTNRLVRAVDEMLEGTLSVEGLRAELGVRHLGTLEALRRELPGLPEEIQRQAAGELHRRLIDLTEDLRSQVGRKLVKPEVLARILACGERLNAPLLAAALAGLGLAAQAVDAARVLRTRGLWLDAEPDIAASREPWRELVAALPPGTIPVFTGFLGADHQGRITLLGRGGSDTSATVLAAVAGAERVEIWSDVDGVMTADPRQDPEAVLLPWLSYEEAFDLAERGAKVLHPKAVEPARDAGIPILVRNTFAPERRGTTISEAGIARAAAQASALEVAVA